MAMTAIVDAIQETPALRSRAFDLHGQFFDDLTVLCREPNNKSGHAMWRCRCVCGRETIVYGTNLRHGKTRSCGCKTARRVGDPERTGAGRICARCGLWKPSTEFRLTNRGGRRKYPRSYCRPCYNDWQREAYRKKPAEWHQRRNHERGIQVTAIRLGVTTSELDILLKQENDGCAICGQGPSGRHSRLSVDHDHRTGRVRGLLCMNCNQAIGKFRDDPELLRRAANYLEAHHGD